MCHHVFMYDGRDKYTNSQINSSIKYISNTHGGVMQNKIYSNIMLWWLHWEELFLFMQETHPFF